MTFEHFLGSIRPLISQTTPSILITCRFADRHCPNCIYSRLLQIFTIRVVSVSSRMCAEDKAQGAYLQQEEAMSQNKKVVPDGFHTVTPYLVVPGVARLLDFLREAFGAEETIRASRDDGSIAHAAVRIGDSMVEMGEGAGEWTAVLGSLHLYVKDADKVYRTAMQAGAESLYTPQDMDYGDHEGGVKD